MKLKSKLRAPKRLTAIISLVAIIILSVVFQGCEKEIYEQPAESGEDIITSETTRDLYATLPLEEIIYILSDEDYVNQEFFITKGDEIGGVVYYDIYNSTPDSSINRLKSSSVESEDGWIKWGKACNILDYRKFAKDMEAKYGANCFLQKNGAADSNGCRIIYHKPC